MLLSKRHMEDSVRFFPYEQAPAPRENRLSELHDEQVKHPERSNSGKRLASAIVTPSRHDHEMEGNVTKRTTNLNRSISFSTLADEGDEQVIEALKDMDIEEQQDARMTYSAGEEDDLLGWELEKMEKTKILQDVAMTESKPEGRSTSSRHDNKGSKAALPIKNFEMLRRGSPRKHSSSSHRAHMARDQSKPRRNDQGYKKQRGSSSKGDGEMSSKNSSRLYP